MELYDLARVSWLDLWHSLKYVLPLVESLIESQESEAEEAALAVLAVVLKAQYQHDFLNMHLSLRVCETTTKYIQYISPSLSGPGLPSCHVGRIFMQYSDIEHIQSQVRLQGRDIMDCTIN